jgi:PilZ domain
MTRATQQQDERRSVVRYRTEVPVTFHWGSTDANRTYSEGVTRDISVAGAYVFSEICPPIDALVHVDILLPMSSGADKPRMSAKMRVVRIDDRSRQQKTGFSVTGKSFALLSVSKYSPSDSRPGRQYTLRAGTGEDTTPKPIERDE